MEVLMQVRLDELAGGNVMGDVAFQKWALVVGCLFGSITLFVATLATVATLGVLAGRPMISSGYASGPSLSSRVHGDFWPSDSRINVLLPLQGIAG
jgi:hypothetical protein